MLGRLRLISGLVLFIFVLGHFSNHAMGIVSLAAMDKGLQYVVEPWRTLPGTILLTLALGTHVALALWALYSKRSIKMRIGEAVQISLGLLIPIILAGHVLATRGGYEMYGIEGGYSLHLYAQWIRSPLTGLMDATALLVVWVHACLGWHFWLRLKPWYSKVQIYGLVLALIVPVLGLAGIISGGFRVLRLAKSERWSNRLLDSIARDAEAYGSFIDRYEVIIQLAVIGLAVLIVGVYLLRQFVLSLPGGETLKYRDAAFSQTRELKIRPDVSVLDLLREANVSHASVCGGRGRCSTCRVKIDSELDDISAPSSDEIKVLKRIGAPPNVRLACQLIPQSSLAVTALLHPQASAAEGFAKQRSHNGEEQDIAVLFADIRAFTKLSESQLPYDTAFLLNHYFAAMGKAIEDSGGHLDKFIGDGVMALFGIDKSLEEGCREAMATAKSMAERLEQLNATLTQDISEPLRIGIGVHCGKAIVGNMGYNRAIGLTAIGDVVNTASRLETLTKEFKVQLIVSEKTAKLSGLDFSQFPRHKTEIRGRVDPLDIHTLDDASKLPSS